MRRRGRPRGHAPAVQADPVVCGPCGARLATPAEYAAHAARCHMASPLAREADGIRALSNATISLIDRLPPRRAAAVSYAIQRAGLGLGTEQRYRLAWLVDEITDCLPPETSS